MAGKYLKIRSLPVLNALRLTTKNKVSKELNMSKENPNYPSKTGEPSGKGRGNTPKRK
ncbi:TPA: hypothetical protein I7269_15365 [Vibrio parahaemolyticus]|uniref:Uncharacterized protein n=1 Tax=Vibrio parahaemolyticus TaxID=670 RepID=A0A8H9MX35_VIBPH|nr:hypothetical protein [Vibrio parahaemolyticus]HAS6678353.1 hypothetical protein [Vibrio parahaemolyticus]